MDSKFSDSTDVGTDPVVFIQAPGDIPNHVFDEFRVVIGPFGHEFLVRPFQQTIELQDASSSTRSITSSIQIKPLVRTLTVTCERWLWAP